LSNNSYNRRIWSWCLYDAGNSGFATTIMAAVLPVFFREVSSAGLPAGMAAIYWGYASSAALLIGAALAPLLGSIADVSGTKKKFLAFFTFLGVAATGCLVTAGEGQWLRVVLLYGLASIGFSVSMIFYDSLLPHITSPDRIDMVSSQGYALGYLGGGALLALNMVMMKAVPGIGGIRLSFFSVALWWAALSVPLFLYIPEPFAENTRTRSTTEAVKNGFHRLVATFGEIRRFRHLFMFLLAFWLYNDGVGTIMKMAAIYGSELGIGMGSLVGALLATQFVGVPFALLFGRLASRIGGKNAIITGLVWYSVVSIGAFFLSSAWHFWVLAIAVGMVQGGVQAISRSTFGAMVPRSRSAEFFGFYDIFSKFSGVAGPALFALVAQITGSMRFSISMLLIFFVLGIMLLRKVDVGAGRAAAAGVSGNS